MDRMTFIPIGHVNNSAGHDTRSDEFEHLISRIVIDERFGDGLDGIELNELITVVFYFDRNNGEYRLRIHPRGDEARPITGVFNTRSQFRPNPIGVTVVKLIEREDNTLVVEGLDALDGTPVLDLKPFVRTFDEGREPDDPRQDRALKSR